MKTMDIKVVFLISAIIIHTNILKVRSLQCYEYIECPTCENNKIIVTCNQTNSITTSTTSSTTPVTSSSTTPTTSGSTTPTTSSSTTPTTSSSTTPTTSSSTTPTTSSSTTPTTSSSTTPTTSSSTTPTTSSSTTPTTSSSTTPTTTSSTTPTTSSSTSSSTSTTSSSSSTDSTSSSSSDDNVTDDLLTDSSSGSSIATSEASIVNAPDDDGNLMIVSRVRRQVFDTDCVCENAEKCECNGARFLSHRAEELKYVCLSVSTKVNDSYTTSQGGCAEDYGDGTWCNLLNEDEKVTCKSCNTDLCNSSASSTYLSLTLVAAIFVHLFPYA